MFDDQYMNGGDMNSFNDQYGGGMNSFNDQYGGGMNSFNDQNGGGGGAGGHQKQMMQMGLTTASLALGFLCVATVVIGFSSTSSKECTLQAKETPILMALFVGGLAAGTWKLRNHLMQGFTILDSLPPFFTGGGMGGGKPQQPPQMLQWENWTTSWLLCFVLVVWGGIFMLETYSVTPLERVCPTESVEEDGSKKGGVLHAAIQMRKIVYGILVLITVVPLYMAWQQRSQWGKQYHAALNQYNQSMFGSQTGSADASSQSATTPAYDAKAPENLSPQAGGYSPKTGSSRLFDATYAMAALVGYASPNAYAATTPHPHGGAPRGPIIRTSRPELPLKPTFLMNSNWKASWRSNLTINLQVVLNVRKPYNASYSTHNLLI